MATSTHPYSRIWTVLEWGRSHLGDRRAGCFQQPPLLKNLANGRVWATRGRQLATMAESRHVITRDASALSSKEYASLQPPSRSYAPVDNLLLFATTTGSCLLTRAAWAPIPAQEPGGWMCWMCWMGRRQRGLEEYVPLRYSSPSSVYSFRLAPHTSLLKNLDGGLLLSRATASPG